MADDVGRKHGTGGDFVGGPGLGFEPVAHELLVVRGLGFAGSVAGGGPVTRGIGREHFVHDMQFAGGVLAELELGVGEDEAGLGGGVVAERIQGDGGGLHGGEVGAEDFRAAGFGDGLVVTFGGLGGRGEDGLRKLRGLDEAGGQLVVEDGAGLLVLLESGGGEVAAHDGLDGEDGHLEAEHRAVHEVGAVLEEGAHGGVVVGHEVVREDFADEVEPTQGDAGEKLALAGHAVGHDDIEGREAVGRDDEEVVAEIEDLAHLAGGDFLIRETGDGHEGFLGKSGADGGDVHFGEKVKGVRW